VLQECYKSVGLPLCDGTAWLLQTLSETMHALECNRSVTGVLQKCYRSVTEELQECYESVFKGVAIVLQVRYKCVTYALCDGIFGPFKFGTRRQKDVTRVSQGCYKIIYSKRVVKEHHQI
jgi:hypothetical protein